MQKRDRETRVHLMGNYATEADAWAHAEAPHTKEFAAKYNDFPC